MFEHILTAIDGSPHDTKTLAAAKELAKLSGGQVRVVHVREGHFIGRAGFVPSEEHDAASQLVDRAVADLVGSGVKATGPGGPHYRVWWWPRSSRRPRSPVPQ